MTLLTLMTVLFGSGLTWFLDASVRKQSTNVEKWIAAALLLMAIALACMKKYNVQLATPTDWFIQWIAPSMKQYITGG